MHGLIFVLTKRIIHMLRAKLIIILRDNSLKQIWPGLCIIAQRSRLKSYRVFWRGSGQSIALDLLSLTFKRAGKTMNFAAKQGWVGIAWVCAHLILQRPLVPLRKANHSVNSTLGLPRLMMPWVYSLLACITCRLVLLLSLHLKGKPLVKGNLKCDMLPSPKLPGPRPRIWSPRFPPWA